MLMWFIAILMINFSLIQTRGTVRGRFNEPLVTLSVQKRQICANRGDSLKLSCTLAVHGKKKDFKKWTLSWYSEGITFTKNVTAKRQNSSHLTSYLKLNADWSGEKAFTCVARRLANNVKDFKATLNSSSLVRVKSPVQCDIIGLRFIERPLFDSLELYWRSSSENVAYSLRICTEPYGLLLNQDCPHYKTLHVNSSCFYREKDVYNLRNTNGFTCKATVLDLRMYDYHRAYISSKVQGDSCEHRCSAEKRFYLNVFRDPFPEPDISEVVLIPAPVIRLRVTTRAPREVTLMWSDSPLAQYTETRRYRVRYKCSNDSTWSTTAYLIQPTLTLNSVSFQNYRPYDLCRFCVTARAFQARGLDSEPLCKDIRLHEEPPSRAPNITCPGNQCQSTRDAHARNVSITWTLPPRRDWNGLLTEVRVFYRDGLDNSLEYSSDYSNSIKVPIRNNTANGKTLLTGLSINETYWVKIVACNKEGCSHPGMVFTVPPLTLPASHEKRGDLAKNRPISKTIILVACMAAILLAACLTYVSFTVVQIRRQLGPKIELKICEPSGYDIIMDNGENVEYDVLVVSDIVQYVDIRQLNADLRQLNADKMQP